MAFGDEAELDVTLTNQDADEFAGSVAVVFTGAVMPVPLPTESTRWDVKDMAAQASKSYRLKFTLAARPQWWSGERVRTSLTISASQQQFALAADTTMQIAPLPHMRTVYAVRSGSAVLAGVAALLGEVVKKRLCGWEAK